MPPPPLALKVRELLAPLAKVSEAILKTGNYSGL
jgi:hypothetical protein